MHCLQCSAPRLLIYPARPLNAGAAGYNYVLLLFLSYYAPPYGTWALSDTAIRPSVCPVAQLPRLQAGRRSAAAAPQHGAQQQMPAVGVTLSADVRN